MAFTEQNKSDAYLFFALAFNAAPGSVYGGQIVEAYNAGMTTQQIVNVYTTKEQFTKLYPTTLTNKEFATALVNNVSAAATSAAVKAKAVTDIEAALTAGLTKGDVIFNVLGNLAKLDVTNADWGATVAQINNKVTVAKVLTEGAKALNTTDVALLQNPLKGVTSDGATVQKAIAAAGDLSAKIDGLLAANKAVADFATALPLDAAGAAATAGTLNAGNVKTAVDASVKAKGDALKLLATEWDAAQTAALNSAAIAKAKATNDKAVADAQKVVTDDKAALKLAGVTDEQIATYKSLDASAKATVTAEKVAIATEDFALAQLNATLAAPVAVTPVTGVVAGFIVVVAGKLTLDTSAGTKVTDANKALATQLLNSIVSAQAAEKSKVAAADALAKFGTDVLAANKGAVDALIVDEGKVVTAQKLNPAIDKAVAENTAAIAVQTQLKTLSDAIVAAKAVFTDAGLDAPVEVAAALVATAKDDVYYVGASKTGDVSGFGLLGKDVVYVGKGYELNATGDLAKGDAAKLEVFFKTTATGTDVYVEQKAFGSQDAGAAAGNANIAKITLTGVAADKLVFKDGFISLAA